ncbi:hypothetical protein Hdeb2414_s0023g00632711 [Helianthus debilis subsp. tardiflorus]
MSSHLLTSSHLPMPTDAPPPTQKSLAPSPPPIPLIPTATSTASPPPQCRHLHSIAPSLAWLCINSGHRSISDNPFRKLTLWVVCMLKHLVGI